MVIKRTSDAKEIAQRAIAKTHDTKKVHHIVFRINDGADVRRTMKLAYLKETYAKTKPQ